MVRPRRPPFFFYCPRQPAARPNCCGRCAVSAARMCAVVRPFLGDGQGWPSESRRAKSCVPMSRSLAASASTRVAAAPARPVIRAVAGRARELAGRCIAQHVERPVARVCLPRNARTHQKKKKNSRGPSDAGLGLLASDLPLFTFHLGILHPSVICLGREKSGDMRVSSSSSAACAPFACARVRAVRGIAGAPCPSVEPSFFGAPGE